MYVPASSSYTWRFCWTLPGSPLHLPLWQCRQCVILHKCLGQWHARPLACLWTMGSLLLFFSVVLRRQQQTNYSRSKSLFSFEIQAWRLINASWLHGWQSDCSVWHRRRSTQIAWKQQPRRRRIVSRAVRSTATDDVARMNPDSLPEKPRKGTLKPQTTTISRTPMKWQIKLRKHALFSVNIFLLIV